MEKLNVAYASSDEYCYIASTSIISLLENNKNSDQIVIHYFTDGVSEQNKNKVERMVKEYGREIVFYDARAILKKIADKGVKALGDEGGQSFTTYARLWVASCVPDYIEKIIFIDCDTLILDSLSEVCISENKTVGMVYDCVRQEYKKVLKLSLNDSYYNAGVIFFNLKRWREKDYYQKILDYIENVQAYYPLVDQDILNLIMRKDDDIEPISVRYNYQSQLCLYKSYDAICKIYNMRDSAYYSEEEFLMNKPVILHFCGKTFIRPWFSNSRHPYLQQWDYYYSKSPWKEIPKRKDKWQFPYLVQYILYKSCPDKISVFLNKIMQRLFIFFSYKI